MTDFIAAAEAIADEIVGLRREIHRRPELGDREQGTASLVEAYLQRLGIKTTRVIGTGVVGLLRGGKPGRTVAFRADMDALPIQERTGLPFASETPGVMHACGHDAHTAALLGAAKLLSDVRDELPGNVKFFFQPNEEGDGGARRMVEAGCMEDPHVDACFGAHVSDSLPTGTVGADPYATSAASDVLTIRVHGKSAHGARPQAGIDALLIGAQIVVALQTVVSRSIDALESAVITIGQFSSGTAINIIANEAVIRGTVRTLQPDCRAIVRRRIVKVAEGVAQSMGGTAEVELQKGHCGIWNDPEMTKLVQETSVRLFGQDRLVTGRKPSMGTEDFGYFTANVPGCFYNMGTGNAAKGTDVSAHTPEFDIDEAALPGLSALHAAVAMEYLRRG